MSGTTHFVCTIHTLMMQFHFGQKQTIKCYTIMKFSLAHSAKSCNQMMETKSATT